MGLKALGLRLREVATGAAPPAGFNDVYVKAGDSNLYLQNSAGVETVVGPLTSASLLTTGTLDDARLTSRLRPIPISITDLNTATETGFYRHASNATNAPSTTSGYMIVAVWSATYVHQLWHSTTLANPSFQRKLTNGTWGAWDQIQLSKTDQDTAYAATAHNHDTAALTSGTLDDLRFPSRLRTVPIAITDWNTAVDTGWYRSQSTATNIPQATAGVGMTIAWSTTNILQYFWTTSGIEWRRYYSSSTWQPWERMQWGRDDQDARYGLLTDQTAALALKANIASPSFTGTVTGHSTLMPFSRAGALTVAAGTSRVPMLWPGSFDGVAAMVNTAPTGSSLLVDVNKNGTTIFGTQANRPTIAAGATAATVGANTVTAFAAGDYLTVDVDSVGSTVAGSDLVVTIGLRRTGA